MNKVGALTTLEEAMPGVADNLPFSLSCIQAAHLLI